MLSPLSLTLTPPQRAGHAEGHRTETNGYRGLRCSGDTPGAPGYYYYSQTHTLAGLETCSPRGEEWEAGPSITAHFGEGSLASSVGCPLCAGLVLGLAEQVANRTLGAVQK